MTQILPYLSLHGRTPVCTLASRIFLIITSTTDETVTRDHREADSSKPGPNLEGIQNTAITAEEHGVHYNLLLMLGLAVRNLPQLNAAQHKFVIHKSIFMLPIEATKK